MRVLLMHRDRDFNVGQELPPNAPELLQDLELDVLLESMAAGDKYLYAVARTALFTGLTDLDTIRYRQDILKDCLKNPSVVRDLYRIPVETEAAIRSLWLRISSSYPSGILASGLRMLQVFMGFLRRLRAIADEHAAEFESEGFTAFFTMIQMELDDAYFASVQDHLNELRFRKGVLLSLRLGKGNEGDDYVLRRPPQLRPTWLERIRSLIAPPYSFSVNPRDHYGARALSEMKDRGVNLVANAVAQSADHINGFFSTLRAEVAFYLSCMNLHDQLHSLGEPTAFPSPVAPAERRHSFSGLYDPCLALTVGRKVVGNDVNVDNSDLVMITGANQGGKSTFLRSIGLAQMMMQCGMFVPAETSFCANVCEGLFTHYRREEDSAMDSGKLDEELDRMSTIVNHLVPNSMVLFNESLAATNEREGSEIARQIVDALLDRHVKVFFVTHLYELARGYSSRGMENAAFLRAERRPDGRRTFKLIQGAPLQTSYGQDLYSRIFGRPVPTDGSNESETVGPVDAKAIAPEAVSNPS